MSFKVVGEVLDKSQARGIDRLVLVAIAECAWHDGVTWLRIGSSEYERKTICASARCSKREAIRAVQSLRDELRELETRKVRRGRSFITVYRVVVGRIAFETVDYDRLQFPIVPAFLEGDDLARWIEGGGVAGSPSGLPNTAAVEGDDTAPSNDGFMVPDPRVQGASHGAFKVPPTRARVERTIREPSDDRSASEPSSTDLTEEEDPRLDPRLVAARLAAGQRGLGSWLRNNGRIMADAPRDFAAEIRSSFDIHDDKLIEELRRIAGGETAGQARERWLDEKAADPGFPLEEITAVVATWEDVDDVERQDLLQRAETIRTAGQRNVGKAAA